MAKAEKAKPKKKKTKRFDKAQSERFRKIARELGADQSMTEFREAFSKIALAPPAKQKRK